MSDYKVTIRSVVHRDDCSYLRAAKDIFAWRPGAHFSWDKPCRRCLPDGLPRGGAA